jgi:hypothetical protein
MRTQTESIARRAAKDITKGYDIKVRIEMAIEQALAQRTEPVGVMVSMDVSKGDEPEYRIFGRIYEVMKDGEGKDEVTYLAIEDSRNFDTPPQRTEQEPVAFKIYKPTPPRHAIPNVRDAELPWVYDQDPSSGNVASMWVTPVKHTHPPQRTEQNFCSRCGKRTKDIHTCTPPMEKNT